MDWDRVLNQQDLVKFLADQGEDFVIHAVLWDRALVNLYVTEHEDFLKAFLKRYEYSLKGDYSEFIHD